MAENIDVNQERLARIFMELVRLDSVSKEEALVCRHLRGCLEGLGAATFIDDAAEQVGGNSGNLIAHLPGKADVAPLLLSAHMDTVEPGRGIRPFLDKGIFTSQGDTILGADDKCGVAIILEALACIQENHGMAVGPIEVAFTVCEELGLIGAKHLDYRLLSATMGYVLDTRHTGVLITRAPAANHLEIKIEGRAAHAGVEPEKGINAIALASRAISKLQWGRIDDQTTCNIGMIQGGMATNIVPAHVVMSGEVRSHDDAKLNGVTDTIVKGFEESIAAYQPPGDAQRPKLVVQVRRDFDRLAVDEDHGVVTLAKKAAAAFNQPMRCATSGGGSDANVFAGRGIVAGVLGTGCDKVHTVDEQVALDDMAGVTRLLIKIIQMHAQR